MNPKDLIIQKIEASVEQIAVIGLGEIGLRLAFAFAAEGLSVTGFETSEKRISQVNAGENYLRDLDCTQFKELVSSGRLKASSDFSQLSTFDVIFICVPTPLDQFRKPDMSFIQHACEAIAANMKPGTFICLESTTYPTTTEDFVRPILESQSGFKHGEDFWLAFSPERVDPGNSEYQTRNTPKVIGALTNEGLEIGQALYQKIIDEVHPVSSPKVAEMVKILENTYRLVNISLINELALLCGKMEIDIWEVIEAAKTKPYGFQAFYPGPGIGGHCIPLDPFYLEYIAKKFGFDLSMINTAGHINNMMAHRMTIKITSALNSHQKAINGSRILFLGVAYKANIDDYRESPALKIIEEVRQKGGLVSYHDPFVPELETPGSDTLKSEDLTEKLLQNADCVVISTNHDVFNPTFILNNSRLIVDLRNAIKEPSEKVYKL
ncbi:nucleotide sugar dehydrogenase [Mangrovibacterium diazotrophicum]|uniref:UDP-N-acetyl-D-glucosamine dehydrogenase n=1 Tax=Mangrovibacterium diazotrophicum TaxID=1261403 RepID=A0A419WAY4_9BACT|nr:nucleotide sugar dehydrogenase [Mangrovibacterium diazotrophicum]RKD92576.1 UDP-N-acetyl-D-glucosamine dehydrogenase [Mangrovibacterium diazotrophicum]